MPQTPKIHRAEDFLASLSEQRGRELRLTEIAGLPGQLCGAWVATEELDAIVIDAGLQGPRRELVMLHEAAHVLFGHRSSGDLARLGVGAPAAGSVGKPVAALARDHFGTEQEWEAEWLATYLVARGVAGGSLGRRRPLRRGQLSALQPLWQQLHVVDPGVTLAGWPKGRRSGTRLAMAAVRAVVEVRDWLHILAHRMPARADAMAAARAELPAADTFEQQAVATAAWIRVALSRPAVPTAATPGSPPRNGGDLGAELQLLGAVAQVPAEAAARVARRVDAQIACAEVLPGSSPR